MDAAKSWTMIVCFVSIICTIMEILTPNGKMEKMFKLVIGAFMLCSIIIPVKLTLNNLNFSFKDTKNIDNNKNNLQNKLNEQLKESSKQNLEAKIIEILKKDNIQPEKIDIIMDTDQSDCILIKKVEIHLAKGDALKEQAIRENLKKLLNLNIDILIKK